MKVSDPALKFAERTTPLVEEELKTRLAPAVGAPTGFQFVSDSNAEVAAVGDHVN